MPARGRRNAEGRTCRDAALRDRGMVDLHFDRRRTARREHTNSALRVVPEVAVPDLDERVARRLDLEATVREPEDRDVVEVDAARGEDLHTVQARPDAGHLDVAQRDDVGRKRIRVA